MPSVQVKEKKEQTDPKLQSKESTQGLEKQKVRSYNSVFTRMGQTVKFHTN